MMRVEWGKWRERDGKAANAFLYLAEGRRHHTGGGKRLGQVRSLLGMAVINHTVLGQKSVYIPIFPAPLYCTFYYYF